MKLISLVLKENSPEFDFRNICWGMTKEEVKTAEMHSPNSEGKDYITYREWVMDMDTIVGFHFHDGLLVEAGYAFREDYENADEYIKRYEKAKSILDDVYGRPSIDKDLICKSKDKRDAESNSVMFLTEWLTERSIIRLILMGQGGDCDFGLLHKSREHASLVDKWHGISSDDE